jgi:hypothetical protein
MMVGLPRMSLEKGSMSEDRCLQIMKIDLWWERSVHSLIAW